MLEKSNAALIEAIHAHTPQHSNPASLLMDMLNIGREAAYRRLRGEVPFTFGEASALCARMHFSLDRVVGLAATDKLSFQLKFKEFTALLETYNEILERDIAFMREVGTAAPFSRHSNFHVGCQSQTLRRTTGLPSAFFSPEL